jgi:hypothetical protein
VRAVNAGLFNGFSAPGKEVAAPGKEKMAIGYRLESPPGSLPRSVV